MQAAGFGQTLTRVSLLPLCLFLAAAAYLVPSAFFSPAVPQMRAPQSSALWEATYSEKFPGCVATVLWPAAEKPIALLIIDAAGRMEMVSREEARTLAAAGNLARTVGACRSAH